MWLGVPLLVTVIYPAPWKIPAVLSVVVLGGVVSPKCVRRVFWPAAGFLFIALVVWVLLPEDNEGWRPYTLDKQWTDLAAQFMISDEENAGKIYDELSADFDPNSCHEFPSDELEKITLYHPWSRQDYPEIAELLAGKQTTIAALLKVTEFEACQFPLTPDALCSGERPAAKRFWAVCRGTGWLVRAANNDLAEGYIQTALEKNSAALQIAKHMRQQPTKRDILLSFGCEKRAVDWFKRFAFMGEPTKEHLAFIEGALAQIKHDWEVLLLKNLEYEKLVAKDELCGMLYETNSDGKVRITRAIDLSGIDQLHEGPMCNLSPNYLRKMRSKAACIAKWFWIPADPHKIAKAFDVAFERLYMMGEPNFDWGKEPRMAEIHHMSLYSIPDDINYVRQIYIQIYDLERSCRDLRERYIRVLANRRGTLLMVAMRRYMNKTGRWPESLDDIRDMAAAENFLDPVSGGEFVYRLTAEGFTLYSKGENGIDEGGQCDYVQTNINNKLDDQLVWPPPEWKAS